MAYQHIEEIQGRKSEKIAMFLTMENAIGLILGAFPAYLITMSMPLVLRVLIVLAAAGLGLVLTLDVGGMAGYERIVWRVRGHVRMRVQSTLIRPEQLIGAPAAVRRDRPLPVGGAVQLRPQPAMRVAHLARAAMLPGSARGCRDASVAGAAHLRATSAVAPGLEPSCSEGVDGNR